MNIIKKQRARIARKVRVRNKISGTAARPRLAVFRSAKHIYVQLIDDAKGVTLASASSLADEISSKGKEKTKAVAKLIAERAIQTGCATAVFDRSSYPYHGQVQVLADAARGAGLKM